MNWWELVGVPFLGFVIRWEIEHFFSRKKETEQEERQVRMEKELTRILSLITDPMDTYRQQDERWRHFPLGESRYRMGEPGVGFGCTTVAVAQLLTLAGWNISPGDVVDKLNHERGYTNNEYPYGGGGLLYWRTPGVEKSFPQFHWNTSDGSYHLWVGSYGGYSHWISEKDNVFYDSITGRQFATVNEVQQVVGVKNLHLAYRCSIDAVPTPVLVTFRVKVNVLDGKGNPANLSIRSTADHTKNNKVATAKYGDEFDCIESIVGTDPYGDGRNTWYRLSEFRFIWSGGVLHI